MYDYENEDDQNLKVELVKKSQERFKFLENPEEYLKDLMKKNIEKEYKDYLKDDPKKYWESEESYNKRTGHKLSYLNDTYNHTEKWYKDEAKRYSQPQYVYYNEKSY